MVAVCAHCRVDPKDCGHSHFWLVVLCAPLSLFAVWSKSSASNGHCTQLLSFGGSSTTVFSLCIQFGLHAFQSESHILFSWSLTVLMVHRVGWLHVNRSTIIGIYVFVSLSLFFAGWQAEKVSRTKSISNDQIPNS